ncbi:NADPH:quinone reductase [Massilia sp. LXY-6]|uniref:NADPH:quinone reductase n=1 Tax=Massilia sp. LXY-6 TaxID=3379823 RepID=UPI003EE0318F
MKAAWYEHQGPARDVLVLGEMDTPMPGKGEVRIRIEASGINPGDVKKRQDAFGVGMPFPRVVPHSDGAGTVDAVGAGVPDSWIGQRVWCYGAQTYRPFGTAAEYTVVPLHQAVRLPAGASMEQGACLGIPGITAYRAVQVAGDLAGKTVLVQGGAGAVGACAVQLAHRAGARVIASCRAKRNMDIAVENGADHVLLMDGALVRSVRGITPDGVDHIVEVAFGENIGLDLELLAVGGSIAAYATHAAMPQIPFWELLFKNVSIHLVGSDDVPADIKVDAAHALNRAIENGWTGLRIAERFALDDIAAAHERVEHGGQDGRIVLMAPP